VRQRIRFAAGSAVLAGRRLGEGEFSAGYALGTPSRGSTPGVRGTNWATLLLGMAVPTRWLCVHACSRKAEQLHLYSLLNPGSQGVAISASDRDKLLPVLYVLALGDATPFGRLCISLTSGLG